MTGVQTCALPICKIKGEDRTKFLNALVDTRDKAKSLRQAQTKVISTCALAAGSICAGMSLTVILGENAPYWLISAGMFAMTVRGADVTQARTAAMQAAALSAYKLIVLAQQYFSPVR